jgi:hypothetical protein
MTVKTEQLTRRDLINPLLEKAGWNLEDRTKVVEEVDTKQSDFKRRDYRTIDETLRNDADSAYVDYLLLDRGGSPLAILEAKRTSKDPVLGQQQKIVWSEQEKPLLQQIRGLRGLPDDVRARTTKELALAIRKLPGGNKLTLATGLASLSTEGDFGHDTLEEVAATLATALPPNASFSTLSSISVPLIILSIVSSYPKRVKMETNHCRS